MTFLLSRSTRERVLWACTDLERTGDDWRRKRVGEEVRSGAVAQEVRQLPRPHGVPARSATQRLPQRRVDDVHRAGDPHVLLSASTIQGF